VTRKLVVLNACYMAPTAETLLAHVDCVVGITGAILVPWRWASRSQT
jgi:hypothetical protein